MSPPSTRSHPHQPNPTFSSAPSPFHASKILDKSESNLACNGFESGFVEQRGPCGNRATRSTIPTTKHLIWKTSQNQEARERVESPKLGFLLLNFMFWNDFFCVFFIFLVLIPFIVRESLLCAFSHFVAFTRDLVVLWWFLSCDDWETWTDAARIRFYSDQCNQIGE